MFEEPEMVQELVEEYQVPEEKVWELVEYASGNGKYLAILQIARKIVDQLRGDQPSLDYVLDLRDLSAPSHDVQAYALIMREIDRMRVELGVPFEEFLESLNV